MTETSTGPVPPYVSFRTLLTQIERMESEGVPSKIDKYFLTGMAGGTQNHFRHALRSLGLIEDDDRSTDLLRDLAGKPNDRKDLFAALLTERFPALTSLDTNASKSDFLSVLADYGMNSGDTQRKALSFFVNAAEYAGIPVSNHVKSGRAPSAGPRKPRKAAKSAADSSSTNANSNEPESSRKSDQVLSEDEMKAMYFQALLKKLDGDNVADDMYGRIELLLGLDPQKKQNRGRKPAGSKPATPTVPASQAEE